MTIYNLGSINADHVYRVPHIPAPGETLASLDMTTGLGGKGANQSVAASLAGGRVVHIGAVGADGDWAIQRLRETGVDVVHIRKVDAPTAHAIIAVSKSGENAIILYSGANLRQDKDAIEHALSDAAEGDTLILQNETNGCVTAAWLARSKGMRVVYSAAPFEISAAKEMLPLVDLLVVNEVEAAQLRAALGGEADVPEMLITKGEDGAEWRGSEGQSVSLPAFEVTPVDTTGAGDTYLGYFVAAQDAGHDLETAMRRAAAAGALMVTKEGTADAIPSAKDVDNFLASARKGRG